MAVELDLSRDLPKVRKQYKRVLAAAAEGACRYAAPCVVGAMIPPRKRAFLDRLNIGNYGDTSVGYLIRKKVIAVPKGQTGDFVTLQKAFDNLATTYRPDEARAKFERALARIEAKYAEQVSA